MVEQLGPEPALEQIDTTLDQEVDQAFAEAGMPNFDEAAQVRRGIEEDAAWMIHEAENRPPGEAQIKAEEDASWKEHELAEVRAGKEQKDSKELSEARETNKQLNEQIEALIRKAHTDELTGLPNRAAYYDFLDRKTKEGSEGVSAMFIDLDGFKPINDTYGHDKGDEVLKEVAHILGANVKAADSDAVAAHERAEGIAARMGGDEFTIALDGAPAERIREIAENIMAGLNSRGIDQEGNLVDITDENRDKVTPFAASIGVAKLEPGMSTEGLLKVADESMYKAKKAGKNQIDLGNLEAELASAASA